MGTGLPEHLLYRDSGPSTDTPPPLKTPSLCTGEAAEAWRHLALSFLHLWVLYLKSEQAPKKVTLDGEIHIGWQYLLPCVRHCPGFPTAIETPLLRNRG